MDLSRCPQSGHRRLRSLSNTYEHNSFTTAQPKTRIATAKKTRAAFCDAGDAPDAANTRSAAKSSNDDLMRHPNGYCPSFPDTVALLTMLEFYRLVRRSQRKSGTAHNPSGRSAVRAPVGGGCPSLPFRLCRAGSQFRHGSRFRKPPSHPERSDFPSSVYNGPGRLLRAPAGCGPFPTLSPQSFYGRLDPSPVAIFRCVHSFLPGRHRPTR
jgi:hypothetical protein